MLAGPRRARRRWWLTVAQIPRTPPGSSRASNDRNPHAEHLPQARCVFTRGRRVPDRTGRGRSQQGRRATRDDGVLIGHDYREKGSGREPPAAESRTRKQRAWSPAAHEQKPGIRPDAFRRTVTLIVCSSRSRFVLSARISLRRRPALQRARIARNDAGGSLTTELVAPGASREPRCCKYQSSSRAARGRAVGIGRFRTHRCVETGRTARGPMRRTRCSL
jgi:hypothetical protein